MAADALLPKWCHQVNAHIETGKTVKSKLKTCCKIYVSWYFVEYFPLETPETRKPSGQQERTIVWLVICCAFKGIWFRMFLFKLLWVLIYDFTFCEIYSGFGTCYFYVLCQSPLDPHDSVLYGALVIRWTALLLHMMSTCPVYYSWIAPRHIHVSAI